MTKKCIISVLLVVAWALFASLFYKTIMLMDAEMGDEALLDALLRMPVDGNAPLSHRLK